MKQETKYALTLLAEVIASAEGRVSVKSVADKHGLSAKFLEQVAAKLKRANILWSRRGRQGGYGLRSDQKISLSRIISALGDEPQRLACPFPTACRGGACCEQKYIEAKIMGKINDEMSETVVINNV